MNIVEFLEHPIVLATNASGFGWIIGYTVGQRRERKIARNNRLANMIDLGNASDHDKLTAILAMYEGHVVGDANIRNGKSVPTVRPTALPELARELRWLAERRRGNDYILTDRHQKALSDAATAIERVAEDRKRSRSLYKGLTDDELTAIARSAMERVFPLLREEIRAGKQDDHKCAQVGRAAVEQLFSIKGASA